MKILVTGAHGQLGREVVRVLVNRGNTVIGTGTGSEPYCPEGIRDTHSSTTFQLRSEQHDANAAGICNPAGTYIYRQLNLLDLDSVGSLMEETGPDAVIHCAAWTAVDAAEKSENAENVRTVNTDSVRIFAGYCTKLNAKFMYISSDFVFGEGTDPKKDTDNADAEPISADEERRNPLNYYGLTKRDGEIMAEKYSDRCFIVRTSWVFGPEGRNFVSTMLDLAAERDSVSVVDDQVGRPSFTPDVAELIADMIETEKYGRYNVTNSGEYVSRYDFAREIFRMAGADIKVLPVSSEAFSTPARRPRNSMLDCSKIQASGFKLLPDWRNALERYLNLRLFRKN